MKKWIFSLLVIIFFCYSLPSYSGKQKAARTFSLDLGYVPSLGTNEAFWNFGLEFEHLGSGIFDLVGEETFFGKHFLTRFLWGAGMYFGWGYPQQSFFISNHEFGHGVRTLAVGGSPTYTWSSGSTAHTSIFSFFLEGFTKFNSGAFTTSTGGSVNPTDWTIVRSAGGMNNSMMYAAFLEDEIYYNTGHINQYAGYVRGKMDAYEYARATEQGATIATGGAGDVGNLINAYSAKGYGITTSDFKVGSLVSRLASATHVAYFYSFYRYISEGDPNVYPFEIGSFKVPDISFYLNKRGVSYRLNSGLNFKTYYIPFSVEYIYKGEQVVEVTAGYRKVLPIASGKNGAFLVRAIINTIGGFGIKSKVDIQASSSLMFTLGAGLLHVDSLEGERTVSNMTSATLGYDLWGRMSIIL